MGDGKDPPARRPRLRAIIAAALPLRVLRVLAYRLLLGYRMPLGTRIGFLTLVDAGSVELGRGVVFGRHLRLTGIGSMEIGDDVRIASRTRMIRIRRIAVGGRTTVGGDNLFQSPSWGNASADLEIGEGVVITADHFFDLTSSISIADGATIGGIRCSLWTHGGRSRGGHAPIEIGRRCYVGSDVKIAAGVTLPEGTVVGLGSVVTRGPEAPGMFIAGSPAKVIGPAGG